MLVPVTRAQIGQTKLRGDRSHPDKKFYRELFPKTFREHCQYVAQFRLIVNRLIYQYPRLL
jgi:hypothetical protein